MSKSTTQLDASSPRPTWLHSLLLMFCAAMAVMSGSANAAVALRVEARPIADPIEAFVTVTDGSGNPITNLTATDFTVSVDGVQISPLPVFSQPPRSSTTQGISIVFAMDFSGSIRGGTNPPIVPMRAAIKTFIDSMENTDQAAIVKFNAQLGATLVEAFRPTDATGKTALKNVVDMDYNGTGTNLFDGIIESLDAFASPATPLPAGPKAIVIISDGGEGSSTSDINDVLAAANAEGISLFTIGVGDFAGTGQQRLTQLAEQASGEFFPAPTSTQIEQAYVQIERLLANEYLLSFTSSINDCADHTLTVLVPSQPPAVTETFARCTPKIVPQLRNLTLSAATTALTNETLVVGTITNQFHGSVALGSVISSNPAAGSAVPENSTVNLVVSNGPPPPVTVPNVVGSTQAAATTALQGAGLVVGTVSTQSSSTVASGSVISQDPAAGATAATGSAVNLTVSSGPPQVAIPSVVGLTQAAATTAITGAGLTVGTVTQQSSSTVASGSVISQSPAAGTSIAVGGSVSLVVSSGPAPTSSGGGGGGGATGPFELLAMLGLVALMRRKLVR